MTHIERICERSETLIRNIPDSQRKGFKTISYFQWFAQDFENNKESTFWYNLHIWSRIQVIARFRLGSHQLEIEKGRWNRSYVCRSDRFCKLCNLQVREDELHIMHCPFYFEFRCQFPDIFCHGWWRQDDEDEAMNQLMNVGRSGAKKFWNDFAVFLQKCWGKRKVVLDQLSNE